MGTAKTRGGLIGTMVRVAIAIAFPFVIFQYFSQNSGKGSLYDRASTYVTGVSDSWKLNGLIKKDLTAEELLGKKTKMGRDPGEIKRAGIKSFAGIDQEKFRELAENACEKEADPYKKLDLLLKFHFVSGVAHVGIFERNGIALQPKHEAILREVKVNWQFDALIKEFRYENLISPETAERYKDEYKARKASESPAKKETLPKSAPLQPDQSVIEQDDPAQTFTRYTSRTGTGLKR